MADRCPTCGARVASIFEHVDIDCRPIHDAPQDGSIIIGLFPDDVRNSIRWKPERSHPGGGPRLGEGWVDDENGFPIDQPEAWAPQEEGL
ncbi:hypothetical protein C3941_19560 [Kaistia algarum]|uniref:hypothetical protein n=1 Tax=Kaistia algarum TaxID=2083279 RepID=UPI000CE8CEBB|nr:hypothetical protein [Kaistia algarum]MCX5516190.1 hypothetical protein [Kaistia algarum]PPE78264.1 hypothetical protein C3941_19560 [Kaistia algarum]